jgi:murein DD-endopeptidase MepM/ murein hydrolase activator NlpD
VRDQGADQDDQADDQRSAADSKAMADVFAGVSPERLWQGPFLTPVPGAATSSFGRLSVMNGESRGRHLGADFRAGEGTPVRAPNGGRVALAQNLYFAGNTVIVDHGLGLFSLVAHLSRIDVEVGEMVTGGDQLGLSGSTGRVTGPHLHWAIRMGPQSVDPEALMAALQPQSAR